METRGINHVSTRLQWRHMESTTSLHDYSGYTWNQLRHYTTIVEICGINYVTTSLRWRHVGSTTTLHDYRDTWSRPRHYRSTVETHELYHLNTRLESGMWNQPRHYATMVKECGINHAINKLHKIKHATTCLLWRLLESTTSLHDCIINNMYWR